MTDNTKRVKVEISKAGYVGMRESLGEYPQLVRGVARRIRKGGWEGEIGEVRRKLGGDSTSSSREVRIASVCCQEIKKVED